MQLFQPDFQDDTLREFQLLPLNCFGRYIKILPHCLSVHEYKHQLNAYMKFKMWTIIDFRNLKYSINRGIHTSACFKELNIRYFIDIHILINAKVYYFGLKNNYSIFFSFEQRNQKKCVLQSVWGKKKRESSKVNLRRAAAAIFCTNQKTLGWRILLWKI